MVGATSQVATRMILAVQQKDYELTCPHCSKQLVFFGVALFHGVTLSPRAKGLRKKNTLGPHGFSGVCAGEDRRTIVACLARQDRMAIAA